MRKAGALKMKDGFESSLLESGKIMHNTAATIINNTAKIVAAITLIISALVLFTDLKFVDFSAESFSSTLAVMLVASYLIYFSMSESGEGAAESCEEYKAALEKCSALTSLIGGDKIANLRKFCQNYSEEELRYRRECFLMRYGYGIDDYHAFLNGDLCNRGARRVFRRAEKLRAITLDPKALLSRVAVKGRSELQNPSKFRFFNMTVRLIPSMVCMTVTVSVILTAKENLNAEAIADGIFKLSSLILIGLKGYTSGYNYKKNRVTLWLETKARLLDAFIRGAEKEITA